VVSRGQCNNLYFLTAHQNVIAVAAFRNKIGRLFSGKENVLN
jgi:hypothetical protein